MRFRFLGGHLALDFVNTVGGRVHATERRYEVEREHLERAGDVLEWAAEAKVITVAERKRMSDAGAAGFLERVLRLRETLYRIFSAIAAQRRPEVADVELFNRELAIARAHERLTFGAGGVSFGWDARDTADVVLWVVARAAAELLTSAEVDRIRRCGGESCGWLFLDTSRNRSRQWCDMRDCGNVAKVRRFRERQKRGHG